MEGRSLDLDLTNGGIPCSLGGDPFDTDEAYGGGGDPGDGEAGGGGWFPDEPPCYKLPGSTASYVWR